MKVEQVHAMLLAESNKRQLPKHYKNDVLVHDLSQLSEDYGEGECGRFLWMLRTCGSHMWSEQNHKTTFPIPPSLQQTTSVMTTWKGSADDDRHWYHFDGTELKEVTPEQGSMVPWDVWNVKG
jgi:hypothetical protein